eukprot:TRINITY_DN7250_c0_g1_i1.p1 TRINITY_DN7250_c0_g1~~TRINITY_DN7250_c0_g1_i1.p1  ORF type:complete len:433 (+),score=79.88 TRINITY_DN7250_c0_g1_i1:137-1300(+)
MARALYADKDIYLLDDPLSALDAHVGQEIFNKCIRGSLGNKTRILVTHQLQHLKKCDKIIYLEKGRIMEMGTYDELMSAGLDVAQMITTHTTDVAEEDTTQKTEKKDEKKKENKEKDGTLITKETKAEGRVSFQVYKGYITSLGGPLMCLLVLFLMASNTVLEMTTNLWLSTWSDANVTTAPTNNSNEPIPPESNSPIRAFVMLNSLKVAVGEISTQGFFPTNDYGLGNWFFFMIYAFLGVSGVLCTLSGGITFSYASKASSQKIHKTMLNKIIRSPMSFFDTVPAGRILNRFSSDQYTVDAMLPNQLLQALTTSSGILSVVIIISTVTPLFLIALVPLSFLYSFIQGKYLKSSREFQRIRSVSRSPIYSLFSETVNGLSTIRAYDR